MPARTSRPQWLNVSVDLAGKQCLIVGGGRVAERRCRELIQTGARIKIVAPEIRATVLALDVDSHQRSFQESDLDNCDLVIVATNASTLNQQIARLARDRGLWINAAHQAQQGNLLFPAAVKRGQLHIAISTGGRAPAVSRFLKHELETRYSHRWADVVEYVGSWRARVKEALGHDGAVGRFWHRLLGGFFVESLLSGNHQAAERQLRRSLQAGQMAEPVVRGCVYLVGAGPGDSRLLTLRAFDLLSQADAVFYDHLISTEVLACIPTDVEKICVGKRRQSHSFKQSTINHMMIDFARAGKTVVRLKGGDPFIFGRGGEEITDLAQHDINFAIVPGISAANGCASYCGIPLTHRDYAHSCLLMTAHRRPDADDIDWSALNRPQQTIVLYMGNYRIGEIADRLKQSGFSPDLPIALLAKGTTISEKLWIGSLDEVIQCPPSLPTPTLAIIGDVVGLSRKLDWRNDRSADSSTDPLAR